MNTSRKERDYFLADRVPARRAESLLMEWANIPTEYPIEVMRKVEEAGVPRFTETEKAALAQIDAAIARLMKRYPEVFSSFPSVPPPPADAQSSIATSHWEIVAPIQRFLRLAWDAPGVREREWYIFKARDKYHFSTAYMPLWNNRMRAAHDTGKDLKQEMGWKTDEEDAVSISPPALTPFEQVMYHFHRIADRARHCGNPECPAPYFFAKKKGQKYCSSKCSAPAQREQKREWWRRNRAKLTD
jgi:hypothetical protein